jgi:hypothetical protein
MAHTRMLSSRLSCCALLLALNLVSHAGEAPEAAVDKRQYNLFNPVPAAQLREMVTDRPDKTESPSTVDAGHVQLEMDLAFFTYDRHNPERADIRVREWSFANTNIRLGVLSNLELNLIIPVYTNRRTDDRVAHTRSTNGGFGDLTVRAKVNFWGNDGGKTAFGAIPFLKVPTNGDDLGNHAVEGGLILPLALELPGEWGLGLMTEVDINQDSEGSGYHAEWINSATLSHKIFGPLGGFVEFFSQVSAERATPWVGTFDAGLTYAVSKNIQLDAGANLGLTRAADDLNFFIGISWRF